jgi:hypothetical protein
MHCRGIADAAHRRQRLPPISVYVANIRDCVAAESAAGRLCVAFAPDIQPGNLGSPGPVLQPRVLDGVIDGPLLGLAGRQQVGTPGSFPIKRNNPRDARRCYCAWDAIVATGGGISRKCKSYSEVKVQCSGVSVRVHGNSRLKEAAAGSVEMRGYSAVLYK